MAAAFVPAENLERRSVELRREGRFEEAVATAKEAIAKTPIVKTPKDPEGHPFTSSAYSELGEAYLELGRSEEAIRAFKEAMRFAKSYELHRNLALAYCRAGDLMSARKYFSLEDQYDYGYSWHGELPGSETLRSLEATIRFVRAAELSGSSRNLAAGREFLRAHRLAPENGYIAFWTAKTLMHLQRPSEAQTYFALAARKASPKYAKEAQALVENIDYWYKLHPEDQRTPKGQELKADPTLPRPIDP